MGLFMISGELQFGVCNHSEPHASAHMAREILKRGKGSWKGYSVPGEFEVLDVSPQKKFSERQSDR